MTLSSDEQSPLLKAAPATSANAQTTSETETKPVNRRKMAENDVQAMETDTKETRQHQRPPKPLLIIHLTNLAHVCAISLSTYIVYLCFQTEFEFFTWHPFLFAIGWLSLMTIGVLVLARNNMIVDRISHVWCVRLHWILLTIAIICTVAGFTIVYVNKNIKNKQHFKSWHGIFGLVSTIATVFPALITGLPANYHRKLKHYMNPKLNQLIHSIFGIIALIFGTVTMLLSLHTKWFARRTEDSYAIFYFCWIIMVVPLVWVLYNPIRKAIERGKKVYIERQHRN